MTMLSNLRLYMLYLVRLRDVVTDERNKDFLAKQDM